MKEIKYNREQACEYAKKWAYKRNPKYYNFDAVGGDCTSFVSQCIYAGIKEMNRQKNRMKKVVFTEIRSSGRHYCKNYRGYSPQSRP